MSPRLSRRIPSRTKTVEFQSVVEFKEMGPDYRRIRKATGRSLMDSCWWCGHAIQDGEQIWLAIPRRGKNVVLCPVCAQDALRARIKETRK